MIDYEFRIITPVLRKLILKKSKSEPILISKIPKNILQNKVKKNTIKYLKNCKLIKGLAFRGLPLNDKKTYIEQELQLQESFNDLVNEIDRPIKGIRLMQIPNPDNLSFKEFYKTFKKLKSVKGFELVSLWHKKKTSDKKYRNFLKFVEETRLPLSLETTFMHKTGFDSYSNVNHFFEMIKNHKKLKMWFPKFGAGVFLHWNKILEYCKYKPILLTSAYSSMSKENWLAIFKIKQFKKIPLKFATDHPFNNLISIKSYYQWKKFKKLS